MALTLLGAGLLAGLIVRRLRWFDAAAPDRINAFIIYLALPALILLRVPSLELERAALLVVGCAWLVILGSAALVLLAARALRWPREVTGALLLVVPLSNSAYLGLPLIDALLAPEALPYAILYDQLGNFMALAVYASVVIAMWGGHGPRPTASGVLRRVVSFPPFVAVLVALFLMPATLPDWAHGPLALLAATMGPLAMFIVGLQLELRVSRELRGPLVFATLARLLVAPLIVVAAAALLPLDGVAYHATLAQSAMPPMITAGLMGMAAGFSRPLIVAVLGVATLASAATLLALFVWLGSAASAHGRGADVALNGQPGADHGGGDREQHHHQVHPQVDVVAAQPQADQDGEPGEHRGRSQGRRATDPHAHPAAEQGHPRAHGHAGQAEGRRRLDAFEDGEDLGFGEPPGGEHAGVDDGEHQRQHDRAAPVDHQPDQHAPHRARAQARRPVEVGLGRAIGVRRGHRPAQIRARRAVTAGRRGRRRCVR